MIFTTRHSWIRGFFALLALLIMTHTFLEAAPRRYGYDDEAATATREMRDSLDSIKHEVENHETEIRMFEERVNNQESTIASLRQQVLDANQANKDLLKGNASQVEAKCLGLEASNRSLIADLGQLRTHANDTVAVLAQYKLKLQDLEKTVVMQNQNLDNLQAALKSITEVLQAKDGIASASSEKSHRIKAGDSLEKIARANGTSVKAIKELNNLTSDRIIVGQTIQLP